MWTLVLNCGSSSVKFALLDVQGGQVRLSGLAERLGSAGASARVEVDGARRTVDLAGGSYVEAFAVIADALDGLGLRAQVGAVGHRVVHGGERFSAPALITPEVLAEIRACVPLAPLHNPANIAGIEAAQAAFPDAAHVAVFDTAFHQSMPEVAFRYAVPGDWYRQHGVRRYGFHGTSHAFVAVRAADLLGRPLSELNLVTAHLGNGCSVCAVQGGRSVDTSMGLTPLEGLVMGTRSGDVDPGLHDYIARQAGLSLSEVTAALNRESGLLGLSGLSNDMRELEEAAGRGHAGARLALDVFVHRLAKQMAGMAAAMGRVDGLVFTGGIGENSAWVRGTVLARLAVLGARVDEAANAAAVRGQSGVISAPGALAALVVNTNEELMIAQQTQHLLAGMEVEA
ncbi:acetate kinase [Deinococcus soli (ex Cha et al. 2016)]|uniref:Acetate kinase n=2 Tax=Deinococcus soli (ex Cha et al. 2016) TaxID=1309411 RepID=A0AAE4BMB0_9DEIO|nr:acetate kinase [Deinococcus soli (ex Cha et al. 2016)]MDR6219933.1 acetate kinase [Deinococcus soli (ex Cha et al. 2016)]MDR6329809.1 acetate kinase [Deinococcus soli (ex Cha et al. 2016)]MDR6752840.1 acetate kinase [Deinococcus soli (ex Cha et al. 2016)]